MSKLIEPKFVTSFVAENVKKSGLPVGVRKEIANDWWRGFGVKREGEWFFFTGLLYQLTPYIEFIVEKLEKVEDSKLKFFLPVLKNVSGVFVEILASRRKSLYANAIRCAYSLLENSGVEVWYDPTLDFYSGILLYDLGDERAFKDHARLVVEKLEKAGIRKIVTIDPHTTYALKVLYPEFADSSFEVASYLELVNGEGEVGGRVVVHDPCYYARYLKLYNEFRKLLKNFGIEFRDVRNSKEMTSCCGGPVEALSAKLSKEIAKIRLEELGNEKVVTACPICLANLRRGGGKVTDLAVLLLRGCSAKVRDRI